MVRLQLALTSPPESTRRMIEALHFLMMTTRFEAGCLGCTVWTVDSTVHYVEEWMSETELRERVRSRQFTSLLAIMEASCEPPRLQFDFAASTRGLDYVAEVRQAFR